MARSDVADAARLPSRAQRAELQDRAAPFAGPGGVVLRHVGFGRFAGNPTICDFCIEDASGRASRRCDPGEPPLRGYPRLDARSASTARRPIPGRPGRLHRTASQAVLANDGIVDRFVGDECIGLLSRGISGDRRAAAAVHAGRSRLCRSGRGRRADAARSPSRRGAHGTAFVGSTAIADVVNDFTALGAPSTRPPASSAQPRAGELVVSIAAAVAAEVDTRRLERRTVDVRGRAEPIEVVTLRTDAARAATLA